MATETRRQARARIEAELMTAARRQLAAVGAAGISLREVARELGMVSSAIYRYVESRDALLTRLIVDSYDQLGAAAEQASEDALRSDPGNDQARWLAIARAVRSWAIEHQHDYLLLYGSPVPGYAAPEGTTNVPGTRVVAALVTVVADAAAGGRLVPQDGPPLTLPPDLASDLEALTANPLGDQRIAGIDLPPDTALATVLATVSAWTQMFGAISFEITNQTRGITRNNGALFDAMVRQLARPIGLTDGPD